MKRSMFIEVIEDIVISYAPEDVGYVSETILQRLEDAGLIPNRFDCFATGDVFEATDMLDNGKVCYEPEEEESEEA